ncbi:MAG: hypothetical protein MJY94_01255 [Bacteroidales bacterium]|nr:hypothetical protein [Bacteroidales bacterium]
MLLQKLKEFYVINGSVDMALFTRCDSGFLIELGERVMTLYYEIEYEYDIIYIHCKGERPNKLEKVILEMRSLFDEYMYLIIHSAAAYKNIEQYNETNGNSHDSIDSYVKELEELQRNPTPKHYDSFGLALGEYVDYMMTYYKEESFLKYDA